MDTGAAAGGGEKRRGSVFASRVVIRTLKV
jgi:hypothetical protein